MFSKLKELRIYEGYTQKEIANILNVKRATYAGWECGKDIIPLKHIYGLANCYNVNIDYMLGLSNTQLKIVNKKPINKILVAENIKKYRKEHKITQEKLAKTLKTSQANIHKYESGKHLITTIYAMEFAKNYNYSLDELLGRKNN